MKVKLYASYFRGDLSHFDLKYGVKESNGLVKGEDVILCQRKPFPICENEGFILVEFEKELSEVFVDTDESEAYELGAPNDVVTWDKVPVMSELMYGAYVREIKLEELREVYLVDWDDDIGATVNGVEVCKYVRSFA